MVNVIENRSVVLGRAVGEPEAGPGEGWVECAVVIEEAAPVEGYPNLLGSDLPRDVTALLSRELYDGRLAGRESWRVEAELVGPRRVRLLSAAGEGDRDLGDETDSSDDTLSGEEAGPGEYGTGPGFDEPQR